MRRSIKSVHAVLRTIALLVSPRAGAAQVAKSLDIGFPFVASAETSPRAVQVGFRVASITPLVPGVDFSIATMPVALTDGLVVLSSDLDVTYPIPFGTGAILAPRVGGSALAAGVLGDRGGFGGTVGYNVGVALVGRTGPTTAVRFDFTHRRFSGDFAVSSATIGFVWTH